MTDDVTAGVRATWMCDVCGLPDYGGFGDGLGSCDCPRCQWCGAVSGSSLWTCECDDDIDPYGGDGDDDF